MVVTPTSGLNRLRQRQSTGNNPRRLAAEKSAYSANESVNNQATQACLELHERLHAA